MTVVCAAILRAGTVLAARRTHPPELAGRWEFPGGKVEPGESLDDALVRELEEELGVVVRIGEWVGRQRMAGGRELVLAAVRLLGGEPVAREHDALRWLGPDELGDVDWVPGDVPFLPHVEALLRQPRRRAVFFEEDDAHAVRDTLTGQGWEADVTREPTVIQHSANEDDEHHPWMVVTDAPDFVLDVLVDEHDGWLDS